MTSTKGLVPKETCLDIAGRSALRLPRYRTIPIFMDSFARSRDSRPGFSRSHSDTPSIATRSDILLQVPPTPVIHPLRYPPGHPLSRVPTASYNLSDTAPLTRVQHNACGDVVCRHLARLRNWLRRGDNSHLIVYEEGAPCGVICIFCRGLKLFRKIEEMLSKEAPKSGITHHNKSSRSRLLCLKRCIYNRSNKAAETPGPPSDANPRLVGHRVLNKQVQIVVPQFAPPKPSQADFGDVSNSEATAGEAQAQLPVSGSPENIATSPSDESSYDTDYEEFKYLVQVDSLNRRLGALIQEAEDAYASSY